MEKNGETVSFIGGGHRIAYIDALKGFATICVVLGHIAMGCLETDTFPEAYSLFFCVRNFIYAFHMPLFMMISGFVFSQAYSDAEYVVDQKRAHRQAGNLAIVYLLWSVITGFSKIVLNQFVNRDVSILDILLIAAKPIAHFWYIYVLFFYYLLFSVKTMKRVGKWQALVLGITACIIGKQFAAPWFALDNFLAYILFFYIGSAYKRHKNWIIGNRRLLLILIPIAVILEMICWDRNQKIYLNTIPGISTVIAMGISLGVWYLFECCKDLGENTLLCLVGKYSLEIYVIHNFFTSASRQLPKLGLTNVYVFMLIALLTGIMFPIAFSVLCKRAGIHGLFFKPLTYLKSRKEKVRNKEL